MAEVHLRLACKCLVLTRAWVARRMRWLRALLAILVMLMLSRTERLSRRRRASCLLAWSYLSSPIDPRMLLLRLHKRVVSR